MLNLLQELAIVDANDLTTLVKVPNVNAGIDGASSFFYERDHETFQVRNEQELVYKVIHTIDAVGMPYSSVNVADLDTLTLGSTDVLISAIGVDSGLIWNEPVKLDWREHPKEARAWKFMSRTASWPSYVPDTGYVGGGVHVGENLLAIHEWADNDSDNVPQGFTATGLANPSFSGGQFSFDVVDDASNDVSSLTFEKIFFPFNSELITFSVDVDSYTSDGSITEELRIRYYDNTDSVIGAETVTNSFSSTGRTSLTDTIPDGTVYVEVSLIFTDTGGDDTGQGSYTISDPALKVGNDSEYSII